MLLSVVLLRAVRVLAGSVVSDALVVGACGSRSQVVNRAMPPVTLVQVVSVTARLMPLVRAVWLLCQASVALVTVMVLRWGWRSDGEGAGDAGWLRVVGFSPPNSWRRVPLVPLLVRVVDVVVLLRLFVLPGVVIDDAPGDVDAVGGDANDEGVVGRRCVALRCRWHW